ncbi:MAG TPA: hypothetical protein VN114_01245 [Oxalicibacterium sp.]|uniref:hypothetical protein n=1 Tax=Oxalicibacterium sp. TaxID=2766525 RepID=UPI002BEBDB99|nr:hypothetical protein [Oxalicibacterium sp.]HWU97111.1 hypothetical protein [Oxalicibacterium sp.]
MPLSLSARNRIKIVLLFTLAGPAIGGLPFAIPMTIAGLMTALSGAGIHFPGVAALMFSYLIGIVPAALCGIIYQWIAVRLSTITAGRTKLQTFTVGMLSGTVSGLLTVCLFLLLQKDNVTFYSVILFCSMFAGALCALIARRWTDRTPTTASMPSPNTLRQ